MTEVLCEAVECFHNSGGLRSTCTKEVLHLDTELGGSRRIFTPRTLATQCMDYAEKNQLSTDADWFYEEKVEVGAS